jgi:hypothetical protein
MAGDTPGWDYPSIHSWARGEQRSRMLLRSLASARAASRATKLSSGTSTRVSIFGRSYLKATEDRERIGAGFARRRRSVTSTSGAASVGWRESPSRAYFRRDRGHLLAEGLNVFSDRPRFVGTRAAFTPRKRAFFSHLSSTRIETAAFFRAFSSHARLDFE